MEEKTLVTSADEWFALSEPIVPKLSNPKDTGSVYRIKKVGFLIATEDDCVRIGVNSRPQPGGRCLLPTALLELDGNEKLCRLPLGLSEWAANCVAMAHAGMNPFPSKVEFGILDGRVYAEMLR